ncbi:hypothetical protein [Mucilaginibacter psychrotolerans]|uniref:DUF4145 domain-containing protein n=1 Tax=Mucilaginibacter psychrotolerans TaxID=1524096 RepID=A0A4Y8S848_9SPHI|nr:hypothetical protein [Mucilaginibacter psychrotolerans]TFF35223.1 hypothetical protein E2R66_19870 [Mucilaginibacter psychrotolerans]
MDEPKHKDKHYYRGFLLAQFAALETTIDVYIASYFIDSDKKYDFMNIILNRLTFEAKRTALKTILDRKTPDFVKSKNNTWPNSAFIEELRLLNNERNIFAHYVDTIKHDESAIISLMEFRDKSKIVEYDWPKYESIVKRILSALKKLQDDDFVKSN